MTPESFHSELALLTAELAGRPLDASLQQWLNTRHGTASRAYQALAHACRTGVAAGWLCQREAGGIRYGRIFKPSADLHGFSVDVVDMEDIAGPHHVHPEGEIDLVVPVDGDARFDGHPAGWVVCPPGSGHRPTVTGGRALVLYLLPQGAIRFTS
ncbi:4-hydroxylaminobenzoate lyase [Ramlibacter sp. AN1133]|uniref:4-hydroxylaminobenzoate lyase n=1 Tax=Ramlibacter sp. AN1133 TaxID=3133429 RepID=UPI0030C06100